MANSLTETTSPSNTQSVELGRYRQSLRIGYVEMERLIDDVIIPELNRLGQILMKYNHDAEVVLFDTESEIDDKIHICGVGLRFSKDGMDNAIVFTADPHSFQFSLQASNYAGESEDIIVDYHELTPVWFHNQMKKFMESCCQMADFSPIYDSFKTNWNAYEAPFSVKMKNKDGTYNDIVTTETIEEAFRIGSTAIKGAFCEDDLLVVDKHGTEVT